MIPHIGQALRQKDMNYIAWAIKNQEAHGANIIDLCVDEMSVYPEERHEWIKWTVKTAQKITDKIVAIDSSDSTTIYAGLEAHDGSENRPAINSFNLEDGRQDLVPMAREHNALLFANASGNAGMPQNAEERIANLVTCMEMMDKALIHATDNFVKAGYPRDAESMLIVELDGTETEVDELIERVHKIAKKNKSSSIKISKNEKQRLKFWAGRKAAFPACGDMAPDYYCMDGTIPRGKLAEVLNEIGRLSKKYNLPVANAFHAGDGNLHPLIMYDANEKNSLEKTEKFGADILKYCVKVGGVLTGEHGVGVEKRELMCEMFNNNDIQQQIKIKKALDVNSLLNPGKVYPILRKCAEEGRIHVHRGKTKFSDIPRF